MLVQVGRTPGVGVLGSDTLGALHAPTESQELSHLVLSTLRRYTLYSPQIVTTEVAYSHKLNHTVRLVFLQHQQKSRSRCLLKILVLMV